MDSSGQSIEFTLHQPDAPDVRVRLRRFVRGWAADIGSDVSSVGMGGSAREALTAALQPLGEGAVTRLLADLGLLGPSLAVLTVERDLRSA
jgi:hypothetical protein